jgi:CelD/BcsL family acetyltransferase involved in cellulose biosynthesis
MIRTLDPLIDPAWRDLVQRDPRATAFHTPQWMDALRRTYGFVPIVYATKGDELHGAIPFCLIASWLTGRRLVSLPFSDHCDPLVEDRSQLAAILDDVAFDARLNGWRYVQLRPRTVGGTVGGFERDESNYFYAIDLRPELDVLFKGIKRDNREDIRKADRRGLKHVVGRDDALVRAYFRLHAMTRSTQGVPPQPYAWFQNLARCLGEMLEVHLLLQDDVPIAGLVAISFRDQLMVKYTAADPVRDRQGMGKSLLWKTIVRAKERGATTLDWGRCEPEHHGLAQFKERFGAVRTDLIYLRNPPAPADRHRPSWAARAAKSVVPRMPVTVLTAAGRVAYRHVG